MGDKKEKVLYFFLYHNFQGNKISPRSVHGSMRDAKINVDTEVCVYT